MKRWRVQGDSMWPEFPEGTIVLTEPVDPASVREGDVVVALHPFRDLMLIKRVRAITDRGLRLMGNDAFGSEDSRVLGPFRPCTIVARVVGHAGT